VNIILQCTLRCDHEYSARDVTPRSRRPRLPAEMRPGHVTRDVISDEEEDGDVSSSDVTGSLPKFFYGRASHTPKHTDDVSTSNDSSKLIGDSPPRGFCTMRVYRRRLMTSALHARLMIPHSLVATCNM